MRATPAARRTAATERSTSASVVSAFDTAATGSSVLFWMGPEKHSHSEGFRSATKIALRRSDLGGAEGIRTPDPLTARSKFTRAGQRYLGILGRAGA